MDNHAARTVVARVTNACTTPAGIATPNPPTIILLTPTSFLGVDDGAPGVAGREPNVRRDEARVAVRLSLTTP
jgi:hypothetical protein